jgi:hypothetical protein
MKEVLQPELWAAFGEQGYSATLVPEAQGGLGLGVCRSRARGRADRPYAGAHAPSSAPRCWQRGCWPGPAATRSAGLAAAHCRGETVLALAVDEGRKHRPDTLATTAVPDGRRLAHRAAPSSWWSMAMWPTR